MKDRNVEDKCYSPDCIHYPRQHKHIRSIDGEYVKFIIDKPIQRKEQDDADTRRQWQS